MPILFIKHLTLNDALKLQKLIKCRYNSFSPKSNYENQVFEGKTIVNVDTIFLHQNQNMKIRFFEGKTIVSDTKVKFSLI